MANQIKTPPQSNLFVSHPWHGIEPDVDASGILTAFIELVPGENLKFELDKPSGWLRIDRPQRYSSRPPVMYGLIPKTYCGDRVGARCMEVTGLKDIVGDGDPMDLLVLAEQSPAYGGLLARTRVIGGLRMIDGGEADDKIVAVLEDDPVYGHMHHINEVPAALINRLNHYFTTYKQPPVTVDSNRTAPKVSIEQVYDRDEALLMVRLSAEDYATHFPNPPHQGSSSDR